MRAPSRDIGIRRDGEHRGDRPVDVAEGGVHDRARDGEGGGDGQRAGQRRLDRQAQPEEVQRHEQEAAGVGQQPGDQADAGRDQDDAGQPVLLVVPDDLVLLGGEQRPEAEPDDEHVGQLHQCAAADPDREERSDGGGRDADDDAPPDHLGVADAQAVVLAMRDERAGDGGGQRRGDGDDRRNADGGQQRGGQRRAALAEHPAEEPDDGSDQHDLEPVHESRGPRSEGAVQDRSSSESIDCLYGAAAAALRPRRRRARHVHGRRGRLLRGPAVAVLRDQRARARPRRRAVRPHRSPGPAHPGRRGVRAGCPAGPAGRRRRAGRGRRRRRPDHGPARPRGAAHAWPSTRSPPSSARSASGTRA